MGQFNIHAYKSIYKWMNYFESCLFEFPKIDTILKKKSAPKENINPIQIPKLNFSTNNATKYYSNIK
jgi:hypothetical protein